MIRGARVAASALALGLAGLLTGLPGQALAAAPGPSMSAGVPGDIALPGQSDQPAPASTDKLVLDRGHVDAFTPLIDEAASEGLRLTIKEDVTGLNVIRVPEHVVLQVKPSALDTLPAGVIDGLEGEVYHLPLIQNPELLWPGWETQLIVSGFPDANTDIVVSEVDGPGEVFLWSQDTFGAVKSLMRGGGYRFPGAISQPYPAHTHAAWAFTEAGTYTLTVRAEVTASNGAAANTQTARYTFVVGELEAHTLGTSTELSVDQSRSDPGQPITLTATVRTDAATGTPRAEPQGAVQFRAEASGAILGHSPVASDGTAAFRTASLPPGEHRIVAEFVPTWRTDLTPSASQALAIEVSGERAPKPGRDDAAPASEAQLQALAEAHQLRVTSPERRVTAGGTLTASVDAPGLAGQWVSLWLHAGSPGSGSAGGTGGTPSIAPRWLGWAQLDLRGELAFRVPENVGGADYRLVLKDSAGALLGWDRLTVLGPEKPVDPAPPTPTPPPPAPAPTAPAQECQPAVTLDHGHIDAFTVSAGGGLAVLQILEDVTGHRVLREAETVLLRVKKSAYSQIPGIPGGPAGYLLPLAQNQNLIWPGWDTNRTTASGYTDVSIRVTAVNGPGTVYLYTSQGAFGGWKPILTHGGYAFPGTIREANPAHTHAQWVFSQQGIYVLTAHAVATNPQTGASLTTRSHSYVFQVGDVPLGDVFCGLSAHGAGDSARVNSAVLEAAQEAVAAQQAANAKAKPKKKSTVTRPRAEARQNALEQVLAAAPPLGVVLGIVGGGVLLLGGIAGGTVWLLRGLREDEGDG